MLKTLFEEFGNSSPTTTSSSTTPAAAASAAPAAAPAAAPGRSRDNPVEATFLSRTRLNKPKSEKETWHVEFDLTGTGHRVHGRRRLRPVPDQRRRRLPIRWSPRSASSPDHPIRGRALRDVLINDVSLGAAPDQLFQLFSYIAGGERRQKAKALADGGDPDGDAATLDVLAAIEKFRGLRARPGGASSRCSIRCSRASIRSPRRRRSMPTAWRSASTRFDTRSTSARGLASPRRSWPAA